MTRAIVAAVLRAPEASFALEPVTIDAPRADEVLVRLEACGVCHTDDECRQLVPTPSVLGHEGVGIVEEVGADVRTVQPGQRVVLGYPSCGACPQCADGRIFHCEHIGALEFGGQRLDGSRPLHAGGDALASAVFQQSSFATHAIVPARNIVPVAAHWDPALLAALPCGVVTGAGAMLNTLHLRAGSAAAVFGVGAVGLGAIAAARAAGATTIIAVDVNRARLGLALDLGATHSIEAGANLAADLRAAAPRGIDRALDTSGKCSALHAMVGALAMGGECGLVTAPPLGEADRMLLEVLFSRGGTLHCVYHGSAVLGELLPRLLQWHTAGHLPIERLVTRYPLAEINRAFADARAGSVVKPVLVMS